MSFEGLETTVLIRLSNQPNQTAFDNFDDPVFLFTGKYPSAPLIVKMLTRFLEFSSLKAKFQIFHFVVGFFLVILAQFYKSALLSHGRVPGEQPKGFFVQKIYFTGKIHASLCGTILKKIVCKELDFLKRAVDKVFKICIYERSNVSLIFQDWII